MTFLGPKNYALYYISKFVLCCSDQILINEVLFNATHIIVMLKGVGIPSHSLPCPDKPGNVNIRFTFQRFHLNDSISMFFYCLSKIFSLHFTRPSAFHCSLDIWGISSYSITYHPKVLIFSKLVSPAEPSSTSGILWSGSNKHTDCRYAAKIR